jgi:hypothetical protein
MSNGIPSLLQKAAKVGNVVTLLVADAQQIMKLLGGIFGLNLPKWGIFLNGNLVIEPDSIVEVEYRKGWRISSYPQEQGAFQSYNKVEEPFETRVKLTKGGTDADKQAFQNAIDAAAASLDLYDIVTPTKVYKGANISQVNYRRAATNGVGLLTVELLIEEVRVNAEAQFTSTQAPSGADPVNTGTVQPQAPTSSQQAATSGAR